MALEEVGRMLFRASLSRAGLRNATVPDSNPSRLVPNAGQLQRLLSGLAVSGDEAISAMSSSIAL